MQSIQRRSLMKTAGWTPVPNWVLDNIHLFDGVQFRLLMFIVRRLYGWDTPRDEFSVRFLSSNTGIPRSTVQRHIRLMISAGLLQDTGKGKRGSRKLRITEKRPGILDENTDSTQEPLYSPDIPVQDRTVQKPYHLPGQVKEKPDNKVLYATATFEPLDILRGKISSGSLRRLTASIQSIDSNRIVVTDEIPLYLSRLIRLELGLEVFCQQAI